MDAKTPATLAWTKAKRVDRLADQRAPAGIGAHASHARGTKAASGYEAMQHRLVPALLVAGACALPASSSSEAAGNAPNSSAPDGGGADRGADEPPVSPCKTDRATFDAFVAQMKAQLASAQVVGAAVAVVCGSDAFAAGIGRTSSSGGSDVTMHTRFNVGSTQKVFTAALAMKLAEEGTISLDDPASKWVQSTNTTQPYSRSCTLGELLSHTSGYPAVPSDSVTSLDLAGFFQQMGNAPLWYPPGALFDYSNVGFELAGLAMQNAAGQPFGTLVESKIFKPAGMADATMDAGRVAGEGNYASGYLSGQAGGGTGSPSDMAGATIYGPDTGAWVSADDMTHFARVLLDRGGSVLRPESLAAMTTPRSSTEYPPGRYGYGMFLDDLGGVPRWEHPGENDGYACDLTVLPSLGFASALLLDNDGVVPPDAYQSAARTFTGRSLPPASYEPFDAADMPQHAGTYQSVIAGTITVQQAGSEMQITVGSVQGPTKMTPGAKDVYTLPYQPWGGLDLEVSFARESGSVKYVVSRAWVGAR